MSVNPYLAMEVMDSLRREAQKNRVYETTEARQRRERVAVGRICRCGDCYCCDELAAHRKEEA
jgi:hypothetical protein